MSRCVKLKSKDVAAIAEFVGRLRAALNRRNEAGFLVLQKIQARRKKGRESFKLNREE